MTSALAAHLWQSTWFALAAGLLTLAFRRNRAKVRYALWLSASLKFFLPFSLLMTLGSHLGGAPATRQVARRIATLDVSFTIERIVQPFSGLPPSSPASSGPAQWTPPAIFALWTCGLAALAAIRIRGWRRVRAALRASRPVDIPAAVEIRSAPGLLEPGVVGWRRPILLLPAGIIEILTPNQLEAVLAHELCHVRRRDNLFSALHMIVEAVFWFHPLVWWIGSRLVEERERACDEGVLSLGNQPRIYADAILNVCKLYVESPLVCVSGVTGANLKRRIEAIMTNRTGQGLNRAKKILLAAAGVAVVAGPIAIGILIGAGSAPAVHAQTAAAHSEADAPQAAGPRYKDRRLMAMLFDLDAMTADEQSVARQAASRFVNDNMLAADLVTLMTAANGEVRVVEDFTDDRAALQSAIGAIAGGNASGSSAELRIARLEKATRMLGVLPQKKALMYFAGGIEPAGANDRAALAKAIQTAQNANVAYYLIDARGSITPPSGEAQSAATAAPQDETSRRMAYSQTNFGSASGAMGRAYVRYGPPDQIEDRGSDGQIWRYNYLENFHSNVELEFGPGKRANNVRIAWPPPVATFTGVLEWSSSPANVILGLPGGHASMQTYPAGEMQTLSVPLGSLSGQIAINAQVQTVQSANGSHTQAGTGANFAVDQFQIKDPSGAYRATFILGAGSYVCNVSVKEEAAGRTYGETIYFQVN